MRASGGGREGERRERDEEGKQSRRIPRVCGNRTSPKTLAPSFSAFFLPSPFRLLPPMKTYARCGRGGKGESRGRDTGGYRVGGRLEERKRESTCVCVYVYVTKKRRESTLRAHFDVCALPARLDTAPTLVLDVESSTSMRAMDAYMHTAHTCATCWRSDLTRIPA